MSEDGGIASAHVLLLWSLSFLVVPMAAEGLGLGDRRLKRGLGVWTPIAFALLLALPPRSVTLVPALASSLAFAALITVGYVALSPLARSRVVTLLTVVWIVDVISIATLMAASAKATSWLPVALLVVVAPATSVATAWVAKRLDIKRPG